MRNKTDAAKHLRHYLGFISIIIFGLLFCFSSQVSAEKKPDLIRVVNILDLSGPYAPVTGPLGPGFEDAWQYINGELDGVYGVKVDAIIRDFAGKMPVGLSMYNEAVNMKPKPLICTPGSAPLAAALHDRFVEDGIVSLISTSVDAVYPSANSFGIYPLYPDMIALTLKYVKDNWTKKRNPRMGIISWDTGYGRAIMIDELYNYAKKIGVDIVGKEVFGIREVDVTNQLLRLRSKKADYLVTNCAASGPIAIKKGCREMGWKIPLINTVGSAWGTVGLAPQLFEGDITVFAVKSFDEVDDPSIKTVMKYFKQNNRTKRDISVFYLIGWQVALTEQSVFKSIVDKYGWGGLNAENIKEMLYKLDNYKPLYGLSNISYSKDRPAMRKARIYKIQNKKLIPLTGFLEVPDLRPKKFR